MQVTGRTVAITGAGSGIGAALARAFAAAGAAHIAISDIDRTAAAAVAHEIGGSAHQLDVADGDAIAAFVDAVARDHGPIDIFCSNAGILPMDFDIDRPQLTADAVWQRSWDVNVMAHLRAARAVLPAMLERREGLLLQTVSAAGLLTMIGSAAYSATKHAAIGLAESLAITLRGTGVHVSVVAPQAVDTAMTRGKKSFGAEINGILSADMVAAAALAGIAENRFLILPHAEVASHMQRKAADPERWIGGMARLRRSYVEGR